MVHKRDTEKKSYYLIQIVYIGHLIKIQLNWVNWVSYVKVLVWLVKLVKLHLSNGQVSGTTSPEVKVHSLASNLLPSLISVTSSPCHLFPSLSPPAHYASSPISCTAATMHVHTFITLHACFHYLGYLSGKVSPTSLHFISSFKSQL